MSMIAAMADSPVAVVAQAGAAGDRALSPGDLAELLSAFNDVTGRLQRTHETLRAEVSRLETELRESREQLRRAKHLAALGEMAAGIAHEVRNPLGSVKLYAKVLREDLTDRPAQREVAEKIDVAVRRLDAVVGDVLLFARERPLRLEQVKVIDVLREAAESCGEVLVRHGVEVQIEDCGEMSIAADAGLLRQALVNLVRNAAEAMGEAGTGAENLQILMGVRRRRLLNAEGRREPMTAIFIRDRGPGVPPGLAEKLFDPFITTRHEGTGLGLAIVHRIIDAHGGRVSLRNNPGEPGAIAEILMPESGRLNEASQGKTEERERQSLSSHGRDARATRFGRKNKAEQSRSRGSEAA